MITPAVTLAMILALPGCGRVTAETSARVTVDPCPPGSQMRDQNRLGTRYSPPDGSATNDTGQIEERRP